MKLHALLSVFIAISLSPAFAEAPDTVISIDGNGEGAKFEGIGIVSAGASTRQLIDYPEPYRSDILDWLFKPGFGMALQHLKVEIGGDVNSTCGSEPSYAHTLEEMSKPNYQRGYEYWLMKEARKRNPKILLEGLSWGAPYFVKEDQAKDKHAGQFYTPACADWLVGFLKGARSWGVEMDYLAAEQNESPPSPTWQHAASWITEQLRPKLDEAGFKKVQLVSDGIGYALFTNPAYSENAALQKLIGSTGDHYIYGKKPWPPEAIERSMKSGVPIWDNEAFCGSGKTWERSMWVAEEISMNYSRFHAVKYQAWTPLGAALDGTKYKRIGFLSAVEPWSGYYEVYPATWVCAHYTQFVDSGWRFLDAGTGGLFPGPLPKYDNVIGWRAVYEIPGNVTFKNNENTQSSKRARLRYATFVSPDEAKDFSIALPYTDDFESYKVIGQAPRYSQDQSGSFEIWKEKNGNQCVRQMSPIRGLMWANEDQYASTALGDTSLSNYTVSIDAMIEGSGTVALWGRVYYAQAEGLNGYRILVTDKGDWTLAYEKIISGGKPNEVTMLAQGNVSMSADKWHKLQLRCYRTQITAWIDGKQVAQVEDKSTASGKIGLSTGYHYAKFDNLEIEPIPGELTANIVRAVATSDHVGYEAANAIDGDAHTLWHAEWMPLAPLPQALTVELDKAQPVRAVRFLPRPGANQNCITKARVLTSFDGKEFKEVAQADLVADDGEKEIRFPAVVKACFVKLEALETVRGAACLGEISVMLDEHAK